MGDVDDDFVDLLIAVTRAPGSIKAWRSPALDMFYDHRFFASPPQAARKWKPVIHALVTSDKERFVDLIGTLVKSLTSFYMAHVVSLQAKVSPPSSANIFTNREHEMQLRALSLRRLSYAIFAGENNRYLAQLPSIQEKVVDLLRANVGEIVHSEVRLSSPFHDSVQSSYPTLSGLPVSPCLAVSNWQPAFVNILACHSDRTGTLVGFALYIILCIDSSSRLAAVI
jgi:hypothetical protein